MEKVHHTVDASDVEDQTVVERDPTGRFERYSQCLGRGAYKEVYKAFDQEEGVEVAWNQLRMDHILQRNISRVLSEIQILQSLRNDHIIASNFFHSWIAKGSDSKDTVFFITELMTSGTLKSYIKRTSIVKPKVLKNWCRQILSGLAYLHSRSPPIIHRDLKCDNIFINGNNGQAKIGDLGLAVVKHSEHVSSVLGTPEFLAPEVYDEKYDEKVDIYSFGLVVLEIVTKEYPYSECSNQAQIFKKVSTGIKPLALAKVVDEDIRSFIQTCIQYNPQHRPSAQELLSHPFLVFDGQASSSNLFDSMPSMTLQVDEMNAMDGPLHSSIKTTVVDSHNHTFSIRETNQLEIKAESDSNLCIVEVVDRPLHDEVVVRMIYGYPNGSASDIKFPFKLSEDTATEVIAEMIREKIIPEFDEKLAKRKLEEVLRLLQLTDSHPSLPTPSPRTKAVDSMNSTTFEATPQSLASVQDGKMTPLKLPGTFHHERNQSTSDSMSTQSTSSTEILTCNSQKSMDPMVQLRLKELQELNLKGLGSMGINSTNGQASKMKQGQHQEGQWPLTFGEDRSLVKTQTVPAMSPTMSPMQQGAATFPRAHVPILPRPIRQTTDALTSSRHYRDRSISTNSGMSLDIDDQKQT